MSGFVLRGASSAVVRGGESATDWFLSCSFSAEKGPTVLFNLHGRTFFFSFLESTRSSGHFPPIFLTVFFAPSCCSKPVLTHFFSFISYSVFLVVIVCTVTPALNSLSLSSFRFAPEALPWQRWWPQRKSRGRGEETGRGEEEEERTSKHSVPSFER